MGTGESCGLRVGRINQRRTAGGLPSRWSPETTHRWLIGSLPRPPRRGCGSAHGAVRPGESLDEAPVPDFVARKEFDFTGRGVAEGKPVAESGGTTYRAADGSSVHHPERAIIEEVGSLPFVVDGYKRDLTVE